MEKANTARDFPQQRVCFQPKEAKSRPCSVSQIVQGTADKREALQSLEQLTRIYCVCVLFLRSSVMPKDCFTAAWILISVLTKFENEKLAVGFCPDGFVCCPYIPYRYILFLFSLCLTISSNPNLLCFPLKSFPQYSLDAQFLDPGW